MFPLIGSVRSGAVYRDGSHSANNSDLSNVLLAAVPVPVPVPADLTDIAGDRVGGMRTVAPCSSSAAQMRQTQERRAPMCR